MWYRLQSESKRRKFAEKQTENRKREFTMRVCLWEREKEDLALKYEILRIES